MGYGQCKTYFSLTLTYTIVFFYECKKKVAGTNAPGQKATRTKTLKKVVGESLPVLQNAVGLMESDTYKTRA